MRYEKSITVEKAKANYINRLLNVQPKFEKECFGENEKHSDSVTFENGYKMYVDICGVQYEDGGDNTAWSQAVLHDKDGFQLAYTEPSVDYLGEWEITFNGDVYVMNISTKD